MKKNIIMIALFSLTAAASALAAPAVGSNVLEAQLNRFNIDAQIAWHEAHTGKVTIDLNNKMVTVSVQPASNCPAGEVCSEVISAPEVVELPLVSVTHDACGATIYSAERDLRMSDSDLQSLQVRDYSTDHCMILYMSQTVVTYTTDAPYTAAGEFKTSSTFSGVRLQAAE